MGWLPLSSLLGLKASRSGLGFELGDVAEIEEGRSNCAGRVVFGFIIQGLSLRVHCICAGGAPRGGGMVVMLPRCICSPWMLMYCVGTDAEGR